MEILLPRMMKKGRKIHSHTMHQEIKRAKQMKKEIQNYMIITKDNLLTKVTLKNGTSVNYRYDHNGKQQRNLSCLVGKHKHTNMNMM